MTLQQLRYVTTIANIGSISEAAKRLLVSQPSLTKAIKELEKEMGITISIAPIRALPYLRRASVFRRMHAKYWNSYAVRRTVQE